MTGLSESAISVCAATSGIAEADRVGIAANAQAATPINNSLFILGILREPRIATAGSECINGSRVPP
jgi:hypothetical protein